MRVPFPAQPTQIVVKAHDWVQDVLEPWQQASAISLVIPLPQAGATDDQRAIVARLADARRELDKGQWKPSIAASREAVELLRTMRPAPINPKAQLRDPQEREAVILIGSLTSCRPCSTVTQPPAALIRGYGDIIWNWGNALLALGTAASVAHMIFTTLTARARPISLHPEPET